MEKNTRTKRIISIVVLVMMLFSLTMPVSAGEYSYTYYEPTRTWKMYWQVRASGSYNDIGDCTIVYEEKGLYTNYLILTSDITFECTIGFKKQKVTLPRGTQWSFYIIRNRDVYFDLLYMPGVSSEVKRYFKRMQGKIHMKWEARSQGIYNELPCIKIDGLGTGFYFKYT